MGSTLLTDSSEQSKGDSSAQDAYIDIHGVQGQVRTALGFETGAAAPCLVC